LREAATELTRLLLAVGTNNLKLS